MSESGAGARAGVVGGAVWRLLARLVARSLARTPWEVPSRVPSPGEVRARLRRPTRAALVRDAVLFAVPALPVAGGPLLPVTGEWAWWAQVGGLAVWAAAVAVSRVWPLAAVWATLGLLLVSGNYVFGVPVASYLAGRRMRQARPVLWTFTAVFVGWTLFQLVRGVQVTSWFPLTIWLVLLGVLPWLVGRYWQQYQELLRAGWERADRLEREQRIIADRERLRERARIAQDMHDSLGHELALIAVRAGALQVSAGLAERHRVAAAELRAGAAEATEHLREIIGVLREDGGGAAGEGAGEGAGEVGGGPRIRPARESIPDLVERARASGVPIRLAPTGAGGDPDGDPDGGVGGGVGGVTPVDAEEVAGLVRLAAHRVVQEGITNAAKHAPGAAVTVSVTRRADTDTGADGHGRGVICVRVVNEPPAQPPLLPSGGGRGLTGLAERVRVAGGTLRAGTSGDGGFEVVAEMPVAPTAPAAPQGPAADASGPVEGRGEWASESARHLARERRQVRRGLVTAIAVPAGLILVLSTVMVGYYVRSTFTSELKPADYDALRVGDPQARVERVLPEREAMGVGEVRARVPEPAGADCRYYRSNTNLLGLARVYRLCFADGRLIGKNTYRTGQGATIGEDKG
ncbi:sensor histidine kinase [Actinomadura sp. NEAU-AAG7]|uniref:sensor histidine kinase n=1 Tax=Actinomadura sp. NEAU-AAG7 TaxID=2839640 RepID=UPI001BE41782|nr:sensor histidine kinase [Actinomadura sp. NEAU-AAG7]MBT2211953.1 two-component sensor histidine kinase [Actinomadura sp. NEAU-AAG7]